MNSISFTRDRLNALVLAEWKAAPPLASRPALLALERCELVAWAPGGAFCLTEAGTVLLASWRRKHAAPAPEGLRP